MMTLFVEYGGVFDVEIDVDTDIETDRDSDDGGGVVVDV